MAWAEDRAPWRHDPSAVPGAKTEGGAARCRPIFPFRDWHEGGKSMPSDQACSLPYLPTPVSPFHAEPLHLRELLKDFHGVLVTDFYAAYDAIDCPQQKCLIHLMRDINQDILSNSFDEELRSVTQPFATLLQSIVSSVDQHGLKRRYLVAHEKEVDGFFGSLSEKSFSSEVAESLRERLLKYRGKLFTFIRYDG